MNIFTINIVYLNYLNAEKTIYTINLLFTFDYELMLKNNKYFNK